MARALIEEANPRCERCESASCVRAHSWRYRKPVTDLSTGAVSETIPILRIRFCSGRTASLVPGELWRGRFTITSVVEAVVHVLREGVEKACEWAWAAGPGEPVVSKSSLRRWKGIVRTRLVGSALNWLGPQTETGWSAAKDEAAQLEVLLGKTTTLLLARFRCLFWRGLLDQPSAPRPPRPSHTSAPREAGRHDPTPSPDSTRRVLPRGSSLLRRSRGPPSGDLMEVSAYDRR